jgi:hypothetical protein
MSRLRLRNLCQNGYEVFEKAGFGAEWLEDADGKCCLTFRLPPYTHNPPGVIMLTSPT